MDWDERRVRENRAAALHWVDRFRKARERIPAWVEKLAKRRCWLAHEDVLDERRGSYNMTCKVDFEDGSWLVRFPIDGRVKMEKVKAEVAMMEAVRHVIPVPQLKAWGLESEVGLGPFIITEWVDGETLDLDALDGHGLRTIFRQIARFYLDLATLSLGGPPLTWKAHEIVALGGVDIPTTTFTSTTEYFNHIADRDLKHLHEQPNSVDDEEDARLKYKYWTVVKELIPRFVSTDKFVPICDDFGPSNMLVKDLKVVAVVDWEWSYSGPYQMLCSAPRWLLPQRPNYWSCEDERLQRYMRYLDIFIDALKQEEAAKATSEEAGNNVEETSNGAGNEQAADGRSMEAAIDGEATANGGLKELSMSSLMEQSKNGSMWFHHIMWEGFNGPNCVPFQRLRAAVPDFDELVAEIDEGEVEAFVQKKMKDLAEYNAQLGAMENGE